MNHKEKFLHHKELDLGCSVTITNGGGVTNYKLFVNFKDCSVTITNCFWNSGAANLWSSAKPCGKWLWNE